ILLTLLSGVINRTVAIDPQNAELVSCNAQQAADLDANRKGRKPNLRFRMGTGTNNHVSRGMRNKNTLPRHRGFVTTSGHALLAEIERFVLNSEVLNNGTARWPTAS